MPAACARGLSWAGVAAVILFTAASLSAGQWRADAAPIRIDGAAVAAPFGGIGGLSAGAGTNLLHDYPQPQRDAVLDYLFKPGYAMSLNMVKVEIGGDVQSTDGTEASHMHTRNGAPNFHRGYEWWLMAESKRRNPDILTYALAWGAPGWVGNGTYYSDDNINYTVKFLQGARDVYAIDIDWLGVWNERSVHMDYVLDLRAALDAAGFAHTRLTLADSGRNDASGTCYASTLLANASLDAAVDALGSHYPAGLPLPGQATLSRWAFGTPRPPNATSRGAKVLVDAEEFRSNPFGRANSKGHYNLTCPDGGLTCASRCQALVLARNWVAANVSSTVIYPIVGSFYSNVYYRHMLIGPVLAAEPWSGHYELGGPMWITAHFSQFARPESWHYLRVAQKTDGVTGAGSGSGLLPGGGSYSTLVEVPPNADTSSTVNFTIIVETVSLDTSYYVCSSPGPVEASQAVTLQLSPELLASGVTALASYESHIGATDAESSFFQRTAAVPVSQAGLVSLTVARDTVVTLTTVGLADHSAADGRARPSSRGLAHFGASLASATPPPSAPFPAAVTDNFTSYCTGCKPRYFADQCGAFEASGHGTMVSAAPEPPIAWGAVLEDALTLIGDPAAADGSISARVQLHHPSPDALSGVPRASDATMQQAGVVLRCISGGSGSTAGADITGYMLLLHGDGQAHLGYNAPHGEWTTLMSVNVTQPFGTWHTLSLSVTGRTLTANVDGAKPMVATDATGAYAAGYGALLSSWGGAHEFDDFVMTIGSRA